ncbi:MAG: uroporphyrinogen-III C-methyltransferase [Halioglobus sp.]
MSDQENNSSTESQKSPASTPPAVKAPAAAEPAAAAQRKSSSFIAWLALLLVVALGAAGAWLLPQLQNTEAALQARLAKLESSVGGEQASLEAVSRGLNRELQEGLGALQESIGGVQASAEQDALRLSQALVELEAQLAEQRSELARFSANDRTSWLLAEAEYLMRLANQRLIMAGDTAAARALLNSADSVLREIDDAGLYDVRAAVAADLAAVRAVPAVDVEGIYLRLAALIEQADGLVIFSLREREARERPEAAEGWQDRLRQGYAAALQKLSDYIIIRRRDVPMQALMDPQWEGLVRQNLRMLLEQAQVALLSGNAVLYRESLDSARHWVAQFNESDPARSAAMSREINQLASAQIAVAMPDLSRSLQAMDDAVKKRLERSQDGGAE